MPEALTEAVDDLVSWDPAVLDDPDTVVALHRQLTRLEALVTRAVGSFDANAEHAPDGAASASAALAGRCHLSKGVARRRVRLGRALRHLPATEEAWLAGDITAAHVAVLAGGPHAGH